MRYLLTFILLLIGLGGWGQQVFNVEKELKKGGMEIRYNLESERPARVHVFYSTGKDTSFQVKGKHLEGEVGIYVKPGQGKRIFWSMRGIDSLERRGIRVELRTSPFIEIVRVKGGSFRMGCTREQDGCKGDEKPAHRIMLDTYLISRYEITNAQYAVFLNQANVEQDGRKGRTSLIHIENKFCQIRYRDGRFRAKSGEGRHPVVEVTWNGAQAFCQWAGGRLPTEAEWEYAARGGQQAKPTLYSGSNQVDSVAWYDDNARGHTHVVGEKKPNELGLYDMSGNVWEWCFDWYSPYPKKTRKKPQGPRRGENVVVRGGSWLYYDSFCRITNRASSAPTYAFNNYGFRLVRPISQ